MFFFKKKKKAQHQNPKPNAFSYCFSLFNFIFDRRFSSLTIDRMPCLGGLVDNVDAYEDVACNVCSPFCQLCVVHEQTIKKPTPSQPCTRISFSSAKENYCSKNRNLGSSKIFSALSLHKLPTSLPSIRLECFISITGEHEQPFTMHPSIYFYCFLKIHCAIKMVHVPLHLCNFS